jgi:hypothetical protein
MDPNFDVSMPVQSSVSMLSFSNPNTFSTMIPESSFFHTNSANSSFTNGSLSVLSSVATPPFSNPITFPTLRPFFQTNRANNLFLAPTPALVPVQTNSAISFSKTVDFKLKQKLLEVI